MDRLGRYWGALISALQFHFERFWREWIVALIVFLLVFVRGYVFLLAAPSGFPAGSIVTISRGENAAQIAGELRDAQIVKHPEVLRILLRFSGQAGSLRSGAYRFLHPQNALVVAYRLATADFGIEPAHITFPEGTTARAMAARATNLLPQIRAGDFLRAAEPYEGYLFPDTYTFAPDATAESIVATLRANFNAKMAELLPTIAKSGHSLSDIVIMASLVEREARTPQEKKIVAGILWNRIRVGMPLQVDAVFGYINGRDTYAPSLEDLSVDSPYNTYTHKGLPPGPIDNPGLDSLTAAASPQKSSYLYYLTGKDGQMHYAITFAEHKANRAQYLQ